MDTSIIVSLIFGISSIIASYFYGYIPAKRKDIIAKQNTKLQKLYKDLALFNDVEDLLLDELSEATSANKATIKKRIRKIVTDRQGYVFSDLRNPSNVRKEIERYS